MREEETWEVGTKYEGEKKLGRLELNMRGGKLHKLRATRKLDIDREESRDDCFK